MKDRTKNFVRAFLTYLLALAMLFGVMPMNTIAQAVNGFSDDEPYEDVRDNNLEGSKTLDGSSVSDPENPDKPDPIDLNPDLGLGLNLGQDLNLDPNTPDLDLALDLDLDPSNPDLDLEQIDSTHDQLDTFARFNNQCLVQLTVQGAGGPVVIKTYAVEPGTNLQDLKDEINALGKEQTPPLGYNFSHWFCVDSPDDKFDFDVSITQDITLEARFLLSHFVTFVTQGSYIKPAIVFDGKLLVQPEDPERKGFEFLHWTRDGKEFDFASNPITEDTTLVAAWKAEEVSFKVVRWIEVPNPVDNPANPMANYRYHDRFTLYAPAGSTVDFSSEDQLRKRNIPLNDIRVIGENEGIPINVKYAEFVHGDSNVKVLGNGNTVVNVFFDRIPFKYEFDLRPLIGGSYNSDRSQTYTQVQLTTPNNEVFRQGYDIENITDGPSAPARIDERYVFHAAYGQDITSLWPAIGDGFKVEVFARTFSRLDWSWGEITRTTAFTATGWLANYIHNDWARYYYAGDASRMALVDNSWHMWNIPRITHYLVPLKGPDKPAVFAANWATHTNPRTVQFFFEALPHEIDTDEAIEFPTDGNLHDGVSGISGIKFVRNHSWQTTFTGGIGGAAQKGTEVYGRSHLLNGRPTNDNSPGSNANTFRFFHTRNRHDIKFNTQGGDPMRPVENVMYGDRVQKYLPKNPGDKTHKGRKLSFGGWFMDADSVEPFDPDMTMPDGNVLLFARWVSAEYKVTLLYDINGSEIEDSPVHPDEDGFLHDMHMPIRINKVVEGRGVLAGWNRLIGGRLYPFSFETPITSNMTLVARWQNDSSVHTAPPPPGPDSGTPPAVVVPGGPTAPGSGTPPAVVAPGGSSTPGSGTPPIVAPSGSSAPDSGIPPEVVPGGGAAPDSGIPSEVVLSGGAAPDLRTPPAAAPAAVDDDLAEAAETFASLAPAIPETEPESEPEADDEEILIVTEDAEVSPVPVGDGQSWALLNLLLSIAGAVPALLLGIRAVIKKRREHDEEEQFEKDKRGRLALILAVPLLAIIGIVLFPLTQDMRHPMTLIDWWTLAHAILVAGGLPSYIFAYKKDKDNEQPHQASTLT